MRNTQRGVVATALLVVVGLMFVTGGIYFYAKLEKQSQDEAILEYAKQSVKRGDVPRTALEMYAQLAWEKTRLQIETGRLQQLKDEAIKAALEDIYDGVSKAFSTSQLKTTTVVERQINAIRSQISDILKGWDLLRVGSTPGTVNNALAAAIRADLPRVDAYLDELQKIIDGLDPGSSGLTQEEIDAYKKALEDAANAIDDATEDLTAAESIPGGGTSSGGGNTGVPSTNLPPEVIDQIEIIDEIEDNIDELEEQIQNLPPGDTGTGNTGNNNNPGGNTGSSGGNSTGNNTGSGGSSNPGSGYYYYTGPYYYSNTGIQSTSGEIIYPPNPAPVKPVRDSGGPSLIEGGN